MLFVMLLKRGPNGTCPFINEESFISNGPELERLGDCNLVTWEDLTGVILKSVGIELRTGVGPLL